MTVLTHAQKERGISLAAQDGEIRWEWGKWAKDIAPEGVLMDSREILKQALAELAESSGSQTLPRLSYLCTWREGAIGIRPELRSMVRSPYIGSVLYRRVPDVAEREALIHKLAKAHPKGVLTERRVRAALGMKGKDGQEGESEEERLAVMAAAEAAEVTLQDVREKRYRRDLRAALRSAQAALEAGADYEEAVEAARVAYEQKRLKVYVPDETEQMVLSLQETLKRLGVQDLFNVIASKFTQARADGERRFAGASETLSPELISEWMDKYGTQTFEYEGNSYTLGEMLLDTINDERRITAEWFEAQAAIRDEQFDKALGLDPVRI